MCCHLYLPSRPASVGGEYAEDGREEDGLVVGECGCAQDGFGVDAGEGACARAPDAWGSGVAAGVDMVWASVIPSGLAPLLVVQTGVLADQHPLTISWFVVPIIVNPMNTIIS